MKQNRYILALCLMFLSIVAIAQTQEQAKKLFNEKKYEEAKPAFEKFVKQNPRNSNLNYWYGACCYETGETEKALPYLKFAADRKVQNAIHYLAMCYSSNYQYKEAQETWENYFSILKKARKSTDEFQPDYEKAILGKQMMYGVQDIIFIDSFVVNKELFLESYRISKESGTLDKHSSFFKKPSNGIVYQTEMKNKLFYSVEDSKAEGKLRLYSSDLIGDKWDNTSRLNGIETSGNASYPYMLSDGITFYYAAEDEKSLGGYDIFVTRYNSENNSFLVPANMGMPFNSPFNDYMLVIDEFNNLGWFASDRYQPEDKVCIYVFIPNESVITLNDENIEPDILRNRARISSIKDSWQDESKVREGKQRLAAAIYNQPKQSQKHDFEFIIDDLTTYYKIEDFTSPKAKELFGKLQQEHNNYTSLSQKLAERRESYTKSNASQKKSMTSEILDLEKRVENMSEELQQLEIETRNNEKIHLNRR